MSIPDGYRTNFQTMLRAADDGQLALMECVDKSTGKHAYVVCMVNPPDDERQDFEFVPVARLFDGDPYEILQPPEVKEPSNNA